MNKKMRAEELHQQALRLTEAYRQQEVLIIKVLQDIDSEKAFYFYNCKSLFEYATTQLKLSEAVAYSFITVSRKSKEVPELQEKIEQGKISVHKAKKICSVLKTTKKPNAQECPQMLSLNELALEQECADSAPVHTTENNKTELDPLGNSNAADNSFWLEMAETQTSKKLEEKVAEQNPKQFQKFEVRKPIGQSMESLTLRLDAEQIKKFERVKELLSSQRGREITFLEGLDEMLDLFIEKKDPIEKALRAEKRKAAKAQNTDLNTNAEEKESALESDPSNANLKVGDIEGSSRVAENHQVPAEPTVLKNCTNSRQPISSAIKHELYLKTGGQCCFKDSGGVRCDRRKWLHIHHKRSVSQGGTNDIENLEFLCSDHHRWHHFVEEHAH